MRNIETCSIAKKKRKLEEEKDKNKNEPKRKRLGRKSPRKTFPKK